MLAENKILDNIRNLCIYGVGMYGRELLATLKAFGYTPKIVMDSSSQKIGSVIDGFLVHSIEDIDETEEDIFLCICIANKEQQIIVQNKFYAKFSKNRVRVIPYFTLITVLYDSLDISYWNLKTDIPRGKKRNAFFVCREGWRLGGIEEWTKEICRKFKEKNEYTPYILCKHGDYIFPKEIADNVLQIDITDELFLPQNVKKIANCIAPFLPVTIITNQTDDVLVAAKILKSVYGRDVQLISGIRLYTEEIIDRYFYLENGIGFFTCVSSDIVKKLIGRGISPERVKLMICPLECDSQLVHDYTMNSSKPIRIGYAGRLVVAQKRIDLFPKFLDELEKRKINYCFDIAGEGCDVALLTEYIQNNRLTDRVKLLGRVDKQQIREFWQNHDICINLADSEGRSRSIVEAMADGTVPVVTATSGVNDDIVDGVNGFIVPIGDYATMAERIVYLSENRELLPTMGRKAHDEVYKKSSMDDHYRFWKDIIENHI